MFWLGQYFNLQRHNVGPLNIVTYKCLWDSDSAKVNLLLYSLKGAFTKPIHTVYLTLAAL